MTPKSLAPRLYLTDSRLSRFQAIVVAHESFDGRPSVILDQSAFYPESGGQLADLGHLGDVEVLDVQIDTEGRVHHLIGGSAPPLGSEVDGRIDERRRREHMALHTGQHILSRALSEVTGAATISARLGETACTIDIDRETLSDGELGRVADLATAAVDDALPIRAFFPSDQDLNDLKLRRTAKVQTDIRVVTIGDFDATPCGGTHCDNSAEVGLLHITHTERHRRAMRIHFTAGARSRQTLGTAYADLRAMSQSFSCGLDRVGVAVNSSLDKLRDELKSSQEALGHARAKLAHTIAQALLTKHRDEGRVIAELELDSLDILRAVARAICKDHGTVALLAMPQNEGMHIIASRHEAGDFDCGAFLRTVSADGRGRGGGRAHHAEGRLSERHDWPALLDGLNLAD